MVQKIPASTAGWYSCTTSLNKPHLASWRSTGNTSQHPKIPIFLNGHTDLHTFGGTRESWAKNHKSPTNQHTNQNSKFDICMAQCQTRLSLILRTQIGVKKNVGHFRWFTTCPTCTGISRFLGSPHSSYVSLVKPQTAGDLFITRWKCVHQSAKTGGCCWTTTSGEKMLRLYSIYIGWAPGIPGPFRSGWIQTSGPFEDHDCFAIALSVMPPQYPLPTFVEWNLRWKHSCESKTSKYSSFSDVQSPSHCFGGYFGSC